MDTSVLASNASSAARFFQRTTLLIALVTGFSTPAFALDWDIKNLGILPGAISSSGTALNDHGQVTGGMFYGTETIDDRVIATQYAFISGPNGGPLQLIDNSAVDTSIRLYFASEISNNGEVVGTYLQGSSTNVAFSTAENGGAVRNTMTFSVGVDINNSGTAVYEGTFGSVTAVAADGTTNTILLDSTPGVIGGINDAGQVALTRQITIDEDGNSAYEGAVWSESSGFRTVLANGSPVQLYDINSSGQVLGSAIYSTGGPISGSPLLVIDPDNTVHTLNISLTGQSGGIGFYDFKLNDSGQVIGVIRDNIGTPSFSFLASLNSDEIINLSMEEDLIAAGWSNIVVSDINNLGQISGTGTINGTTRAFLLTPVPEPETYAMMLAGLSMLGFMRRRKHLST